MRYRVTRGEQSETVDVQILPSGEAVVSIDDRPVSAELTRVEGGYLLRLGDRVYDVAVGRGTGDERHLAARGARAALTVESEHAARRREEKAVAGGGLEVRSPMPGRVVDVLVQEGDEVAVGQAVVVVEAMKMQNELKSPTAGRVSGVLAKAGDSVAANEVLVRLAKG